MKSFIKILLFSILLGCSKDESPLVKLSRNISFTEPKQVIVQEYSGDIMEPFISDDDQIIYYHKKANGKFTLWMVRKKL